MKTMAAATAPEDEAPSVTERAKEAAADVLRQAKVVSNEARQLGHVAEDALHSGREIATDAFRAAKRGLRKAADLRDEASYRVKREPMKWVGVAFAAGLCLGLVTERILEARRPKTAPVAD